MKYNRKEAALLIGLSIVFFRLLSAVASVSVIQLSRIPLAFAHDLVGIIRGYESVIACGVGVLLALLIMHKVRTVHLAVVIGVWVLALLPFKFQVRQEFLFDSPSPMDPSMVEPLALAAHVMDGADIRETVLLDNIQVVHAEAVLLYDDFYQVKLHLTPEGRKKVSEATRQHVGKRVGFFIDGVLKGSAEILAPLDIPYVMMPIRTTADEAQQIAQGILKAKSQHGD